MAFASRKVVCLEEERREKKGKWRREREEKLRESDEYLSSFKSMYLPILQRVPAYPSLQLHCPGRLQNPPVVAIIKG